MFARANSDFLVKLLGPITSSHEELFYAKQWSERKAKCQLPGYEIVAFQQKISLDDKFYDLNVHHKLYISGKQAREYENQYLITLCASCHQREHETKEIYIYPEKLEIISKVVRCWKCHGSGFLPEFHYYENGTCFACGGHGVSLDNSKS